MRQSCDHVCGSASNCIQDDQSPLWLQLWLASQLPPCGMVVVNYDRSNFYSSCEYHHIIQLWIMLWCVHSCIYVGYPSWWIQLWLPTIFPFCCYIHNSKYDCRVLSSMVIAFMIVITTITDIITECHCHIANGELNHNIARHNLEYHHRSQVQRYFWWYLIWPFIVQKPATITIADTCMSLLVICCGAQRVEQSMIYTIILIQADNNLK